MVIADEPTWLHVAGEIAGVVLLIELWVVLLVMCALTVALWYAMRWVRVNAVPIVDQYGEQARTALAVAMRGGDRIVDGVAEFRGRQEAVRTAILTFLLGPRATPPARRSPAAVEPAPTTNGAHPTRPRALPEGTAPVQDYTVREGPLRGGDTPGLAG